MDAVGLRLHYVGGPESVNPGFRELVVTKAAGLGERASHALSESPKGLDTMARKVP